MAEVVWTIAVGAFLRFVMFLSLVFVVSAVHGLVNSNSVLLTLFLSSIAPLPSEEIFKKILQHAKVFVKLRIIGFLNAILQRIMQIMSVPLSVIQFVLVTLPEEIFQHYVDHLRFVISTVISTMTILSLTPVMLFACITRAVFLFLGHIIWWFMSCLSSGAMRLLSATVSITQQVLPVALFVKTLDLTGYIIRDNVGIILATPGTVPLFNYILTGYAYPGSFIRFQACVGHSTGACYSGILEYSFCSWMVMRTMSFLWIVQDSSSITQFSQAWKLFGLRPQDWLLKSFCLIACGAVSPLILDSHCFEQSIHNITCTSSQLLFMVSFNYGFTRWQSSLVYHGATALFLNLQSICVSLYDTFSTLQSSRTDFGVTALYALQLYLHIWMSMFMSKLILKKLLNPGSDVLSTQDTVKVTSQQHNWVDWLSL